MIKNVIIGEPLVKPKSLLSVNEADWVNNEQEYTVHTQTRFLPTLMKEIGMVNSTSEVRRNKPDLVKTLDKPDCLTVKWGKKIIFIIVGE